MVLRQVIGRSEDLTKLRASELCNREQRRCLHVYREASLFDAALDPASCFAIRRIGCPDLPGYKRNLMILQDGFDDGDHSRTRLDLPSCGQIVIRGSLIADGGRGHDDMADGQVRDETSGTADGDEGSAPCLDDFLQEHGSKRRTHAWVVGGDWVTIPLDFENRMDPVGRL